MDSVKRKAQRILRPKLIYQKHFLNRERGKSFFLFFISCLLIFLLAGSLKVVQEGLEVKKQILGAATASFERIEAGNFLEAFATFEEIQNQIQGTSLVFQQIFSFLPAGQDLDKLLAAGGHLDTAMRYLKPASQQLGSLNNFSDQQFYFKLRDLRQNLVLASDEINQAVNLLSQVNPNFVPAGFRNEFVQAGARLGFADETLKKLVNFQAKFLQLLGGKRKTYLLLFQNNNEARATGGFLGTYGVVHFENGRFNLAKIESIYVLDGQLRELVAAPGPLQRQAAAYWGIRDSNWFVDFPQSARKILEFFEKTTGVLADGIISFTPDVFERLLTLTGPIDMPEYGVSLTARDFRETVQQQTSIDYDRELNQPKKFLADFAPRFLEALQNLDEEKSLEMMSMVSQMIYEKHILMNSLDQEFEAVIADFGLGGQIKKTEGDFLAIFHSNVGGGKTDLGISQRVEKEVTISSSGSAVVHLKITRQHEAFTEQFFPKNIDFMRILVPEGSRLAQSFGFSEKNELLPSVREGALTDPELAAWDASIEFKNGMYAGREAGYTEFSNWLELNPGEEKTVELTYLLPFAVTNKYTQVLQKQPGAPPFGFTLQLNHPGEVIYQYPKELNGAAVVFGDRFYAVVFGE